METEAEIVEALTREFRQRISQAVARGYRLARGKGFLNPVGQVCLIGAWAAGHDDAPSWNRADFQTLEKKICPELNWSRLKDRIAAQIPGPFFLVRACVNEMEYGFDGGTAESVPQQAGRRLYEEYVRDRPAAPAPARTDRERRLLEVALRLLDPSDADYPAARAELAKLRQELEPAPAIEWRADQPVRGTCLAVVQLPSGPYVQVGMVYPRPKQFSKPSFEVGVSGTLRNAGMDTVAPTLPEAQTTLETWFTKRWAEGYRPAEEA